MPNTPHFTQRRNVDFHETDAAGLVHFTNILRWMEAAELTFLRERGVPILEKNSGWPRATVCASFHAPLRFGDEVEIRLHIRVRNPTRLNFNFEVWRVSGRGSPKRCASGEFTTVYVKRTKTKLRPAQLPPALVKKLQSP